MTTAISLPKAQQVELARDVQRGISATFDMLARPDIPSSFQGLLRTAHSKMAALEKRGYPRQYAYDTLEIQTPVSLLSTAHPEMVSNEMTKGLDSEMTLFRYSLRGAYYLAAKFIKKNSDIKLYEDEVITRAEIALLQSIRRYNPDAGQASLFGYAKYRIQHRLSRFRNETLKRQRPLIYLDDIPTRSEKNHGKASLIHIEALVFDPNDYIDDSIESTVRDFLIWVDKYETLSDKNKTLIRRYFEEDISKAELARQSNISANRVSQILHRTLLSYKDRIVTRLRREH